MGRFDERWVYSSSNGGFGGSCFLSCAYIDAPFAVAQDGRRHDRVCVLLLSWDRADDDLEVGEEVSCSTLGLKAIDPS